MTRTFGGGGIKTVMVWCLSMQKTTYPLSTLVDQSVMLKVGRSVARFTGASLSCISPHPPILFRHDEISLVMTKTLFHISGFGSCAETVLREGRRVGRATRTMMPFRQDTS